MRATRGFTLIEVLIALAIAGIALTAIIKSTGQNIRGTHYLQDKSIAMWVGQQALNEARAGLLTFSNSSEPIQQKTTMLSQDWYWQAKQIDTPNQRIKRVNVRVFDREISDENAAAIVEMDTYVYHP